MRNVGLLGCVGALILVLVIGGVFVVKTRNGFVELEQNVDAQWAQVKSQYQRRYDLIPNLVRTVQGAANFEKSTLEAVVNARARVGQVAAPSGPGGAPANITNDPNAMAQFAAAQQNLSGALSRLLVVVEQYPELKSNQNFLELQSQLEGTENRISVERQRYNDEARKYNTAIKKFPGSLIAGSKFAPKQYFEGTAGNDQAPNVNFDFGTSTTTAPATSATH